MISWNWDQVLAEAGVVHESTANTDHNDSTLSKQGYKASAPYLSADLECYLPFHEDSGATANDFSGNGNDGTINGATLGITAPLGTTGISFDGTDDEVNVPHDATIDFANESFTVTTWFKKSSTKDNSRLFEKGTASRYGVRENGIDNALTCFIDDGTTKTNVDSTSLSAVADGNWHFLIFKRDAGNQLAVSIDNGSFNTTADNTGDISNGSDLGIAWSTQNNGNHSPTDLWDLRVYRRFLSASEGQTLYDVVNTAGQWTSTKQTL